MTPAARSTLITIVVLGGLGIAGAIALSKAGGGKAASAKPVEPATVTRAVKEGELNVLTLTQEAVTRIDLATTAVRLERRPQSRLFPGEIVPPPGRSVVIAAPVAGTVRSSAPEGATTQPAATSPAATAPAATSPAVESLVRPGVLVIAGQPLLGLVPELTGEARATIATALVDAEGQLRNAQVQRATAELALTRAKGLLADQAGTQRAFEEAQAAFDLAEGAVKAADARKSLLARAAGQSADGNVAPIIVVAPLKGIVTAVKVTPGQVVAAGAPLLEVVDTSEIWVRVSVSPGEAAMASAERPAMVSRLGELGDSRSPGRLCYAAQATGAPPLGSSSTGTIDLSYRLANPEGDPFRPGERVAVSLPLRGSEEATVIPWSAVVYDLHGGAWVYAVVGTRQFARQRVEVRSVEGDVALVAAAPPAGTEVVVRGAAELFGREVGFAK